MLCQLLIRTTLSLLLLLSATSRASVFDVVNNLEATINELEAQAQGISTIVEQTTSPPLPPPPLPPNNDTDAGGGAGGEFIQPLTESILGESLPQEPQTTTEEPLTQLKPQSSDVYVVTQLTRNPQPFTILMNFQNDGTTSVQIFQDNTYWTDQGRCRHGQIFDPVSGVCRDVFCTQGFVLRPQG